MDQVKMGQVLSLFMGEALEQTSPLLAQSHSVLTNWDSFLHAFATIFDDPCKALTAETNLRKLQQTLVSAPSYATQFRCLPADTTQNDVTLLHQFRLSLCSE